MAEVITVRGRVVGGQFVPDDPLPAVDGPAQLIIMPPPAAGTHSAFDHVGRVPVLRTREDIEAQLREERDAWGEP